MPSDRQRASARHLLPSENEGNEEEQVLSLMPANSVGRGAHRRHVVDATMFWHSQSGGVRRYLLAKRAWFESQPGWRHTLVVPGGQGAGTANCGGWPLPRSGGYRVPINRSSAAALLERLQPDLIEVGDPYRLAWAALDAGQRFSVPTIAFCHSNLAEMAARWSFGLGRRAALRYLRHVYQGFDLVLAPSESMAQQLRDSGIRQVAHQPLGVDASTFHPSRADPAWRAALGLAPDTRLLLYAGRFAAEKNLSVLERVVERLGSRYRLLAIGSGPKAPRGAGIIVWPHQADVTALARIYASADVMLHAGDQETFGLAVLEAMACGTPVVVRRAAGLAELVASGGGVGVDSNDVDAWAEAIAAVFASRRESLGEAARRHAEAHDWQGVLPRLAGCYEQLIMRREPAKIAAEVCAA